MKIILYLKYQQKNKKIIISYEIQNVYKVHVISYVHSMYVILFTMVLCVPFSVIYFVV